MNLANIAKSGEVDPLYVGFNQDYQCFAVGTQSGFRVYNSDPLKERFRRDFGSGGIGIVEMLFRCNILALVGGGRNPRYPSNKVMIWDDFQNKCIVELEFRSEVKAVRLRRDRIVVVLEERAYVYNFADLKPLHQIDTVANPRGLVALCPNSTNTVLAVPGLQKGHVHLELYDIKKTTIIQAHDSSLACLTLNLDGTRLATASEKGTLIRIFDAQTGEHLQELRRGADRADIHHVTFNFDCTMMCVSSDKGTIHIFSLARDGDRAYPGQYAEQSAQNTRSSLSFMKGVLPKYFSSEWSFAQFHVPEGVVSGCAFGSDRNTVIVVTSDGAHYKVLFDPAKGGEAKQLAFAKYYDDAAE